MEIVKLDSSYFAHRGWQPVEDMPGATAERIVEGRGYVWGGERGPIERSYFADKVMGGKQTGTVQAFKAQQRVFASTGATYEVLHVEFDVVELLTRDHWIAAFNEEPAVAYKRMSGPCPPGITDCICDSDLTRCGEYGRQHQHGPYWAMPIKTQYGEYVIGEPVRVVDAGCNRWAQLSLL